MPISFGGVSNGALTLTLQNHFPLGGSIELTFHRTVSGTSLNGTTDMTSRGSSSPWRIAVLKFDRAVVAVIFALSPKLL